VESCSIASIAVATLALMIFAINVALLAALFVSDVDHKEIFAIISPSVNTVVGAFVGLLGGLTLNGHAPIPARVSDVANTEIGIEEQQPIKKAVAQHEL